MKIGIIGAGISGLSIAKMLKDFDVEVLEKNSFHGGIARTKDIEGTTYHTVGGHCFNSKFQDVLDFVFNEILPKDQWHLVHRNAVIKLKGHEVSYPIEYAVKQIYDFNPELAINISKDFLNAEDDHVYANLEEWFRKKFGDTLTDTYFLPYNKKIWNNDPKSMSPAWVEGKLPIPDKNSFFKGLISAESDKMPHASFYYPNSNNQNTFIDGLAKDIKIIYDFNVDKIQHDVQINKWIINGSRIYDLIINTMPLNILPGLISDTPDYVLASASKLRYNKVTTMLWETTGTDRTWTYIPEQDLLFHRYIHIGSFFSPKQNFSISEVVGEKSYEEMVESGKKDPFLIRPIDYNVSKEAYVVFDENYDQAVQAIQNYLKSIGIYTLGRFGEWQYYNMDICIKRALDISGEIRSRFKQ